MITSFLDQGFGTARLGWGKKDAVRIILASFIGSEHTYQLVNAIIIRFHIFISNWPVIPKPIDTFAFEIFRPETKGYTSPVIGSSTQHTGAPPHPVRTTFFGKWLSIY